MRKILAALAVCALSGCHRPAPEGRVELLFYGTIDNSTAFSRQISQFEKEHKNVRIKYRKMNFDEYKNKVSEKSRAGLPDLFLLPNSAVRGHITTLAELPVAPDFLQKNFAKASADACTWGTKVWCLPLNFDSLALIYNPNLVPTPPQTWEQALKIAQEIHQKSRRQIGGLAIGNFPNITSANDILLLLLLQAGAPLFDAENKFNLDQTYGTDARGYPLVPATIARDFLQKNHTWNAERDWFARELAHGRVAMIVGYKWLHDRILQENSAAQVATAPVPHFASRPNFTLGAGWAVAVNRYSHHAKLATEFAEWLTAPARLITYFEATENLPAHQALLDQIAAQKSSLQFWAQNAVDARAWPSFWDWPSAFTEIRAWLATSAPDPQNPTEN